MIAEIRIKNYLSFRDEVVLNFEATKDTTFEESQVVQVTPKVRLLRFALIFGANASGKSNLLSALEFLRSFWFAKKQDLDEETGAIPFLLDTETPAEPSEFNIKFYIGDKRYWYMLQLNERQVIKEALYIYNSVQPSSLFLRKMEGTQSVVKLNGSLVKASTTIVEQLNLKCLPNMSFFAARNQVDCALGSIDEVRDWMRNNMMQIIDPNVKMFAYAGKQIEKDAELKKYLLDSKSIKLMLTICGHHASSGMQQNVGGGVNIYSLLDIHYHISSYEFTVFVSLNTVNMMLPYLWQAIRTI